MTFGLAEEIAERHDTAVINLGQWECCAQKPGSISHPDQLEFCSDWLTATVPGTVASALAAADQWDFDHPQDIDSTDWWFRTSFSSSDESRRQSCILRLDGLATLAEVWLNGERLLTTDNMFRRYRIDVSSQLQSENELVIGFRSLAEDLKRKRTRPRWKTNLVNNQQLRWHRTTLQGRIPGWSPPAPAIGPWRQICLETGPILLDDLQLNSRLDGTTGIVAITARIACTASVRRVFLRIGSVVTPLSFETDTEMISVCGEARLSSVKPWWPHTHGRPAVYECELVLETENDQHLLECPSVGFRTLDVVT